MSCHLAWQHADVGEDKFFEQRWREQVCVRVEDLQQLSRQSLRQSMQASAQSQLTCAPDRTCPARYSALTVAMRSRMACALSGSR